MRWWQVGDTKSHRRVVVVGIEEETPFVRQVVSRDHFSRKASSYD